MESTEAGPVGPVDQDQKPVEIQNLVSVRLAEQIKLEDVMPYPISTEKTASEKCKFCDRVNAVHHELDWFVIEQHIKAVKEWIAQQESIMGSNETSIYKLSMDAPSSVMNPKETLDFLADIYLQKGSFMAKQFMQAVLYFIPHELFKYNFLWGLRVPFSQLKISYSNICSIFASEVRYHSEEVLHATPQAKDKVGITRLSFTSEISQAVYESMLRSHGYEASVRYSGFRDKFFEIENKVAGSTQLRQEIGSRGPWDEIVRAADDRQRQRSQFISRRARRRPTMPRTAQQQPGQEGQGVQQQ